MKPYAELTIISPEGIKRSLGEVTGLTCAEPECADEIKFNFSKPIEFELTTNFDKRKSGLERFMIAFGISTFKYEEHVYPAEYLSEMEKLEAYLRRRGIEYYRNIVTGQIIAFKDGERWWDAICCPTSYGGGDGLLEIMGTIVPRGLDAVEGWLTAADVIERIRQEENEE